MPENNLFTQSAFDTQITGRGLYDVINKNSVCIVTVLYDQNHPPFIIGDDANFDYAPNYRFFPHMGSIEFQGIVDGLNTRYVVCIGSDS